MEVLLNLRLEKLPEGVYLATSDDLPGLLAQGRTAAETLKIAQDVAAKLIEIYHEDGEPLPSTLKPMPAQAELNIVVTALDAA